MKIALLGLLLVIVDYSDAFVCGPNWSLFNGSCYRAFRDRDIDYYESRKLCEEHNATMTSVLSEEELFFIKVLAQEDSSPLYFRSGLYNFKIGLIRENNEWTWLDNSNKSLSWLYPRKWEDDENCANLFKGSSSSSYHNGEISGSYSYGVRSISCAEKGTLPTTCKKAASDEANTVTNEGPVCKPTGAEEDSSGNGRITGTCSAVSDASAAISSSISQTPLVTFTKPSETVSSQTTTTIKTVSGNNTVTTTTTSVTTTTTTMRKQSGDLDEIEAEKCNV